MQVLSHFKPQATSHKPQATSHKWQVQGALETEDRGLEGETGTETETTEEKEKSRIQKRKKATHLPA
jgi:hypothetical protein